MNVSLIAPDGRKISDLGVVTEFDLSQMPPGLYIAKILDPKGSVRFCKIIKE